MERITRESQPESMSWKGAFFVFRCMGTVTTHLRNNNNVKEQGRINRSKEWKERGRASLCLSLWVNKRFWKMEMKWSKKYCKIRKKSYKEVHNEILLSGALISQLLQIHNRCSLRFPSFYNLPSSLLQSTSFPPYSLLFHNVLFGVYWSRQKNLSCYACEELTIF